MLRFLLLFFISSLIFSCSSYEKLLKSDYLALKEQKAKEYYENKDYYKAIPLLEELISFNKGNKKAEELYYIYSYCFWGNGEYLIAAYNFKNFATTYPSSEFAEEALFMNAKCYIEMSPGTSLDQTNTSKAINELQLFINTFPNSTRVTDSNLLIDECRRKLEKKDYTAAKLYYDMDNYKAAATSFNDLLKKYPDSPIADEILYMALLSNYKYAINSIDEKKKERLAKTNDVYVTFAERYPKSKFIKDANKIEDDIQKISIKLN